MSPDVWAVLGIEATRSKRDIKRAYGSKLRETRPDDDPVAFQELHEAYKFALMMTDFEVDPGVDNDDAVTLNVSETGFVLNESGQPMHFSEFHFEVPAFSDPELSGDQREEVESLLAKVDTVLAEPLKIDNPDSWRFLSETPSLLDDDFRYALGRDVLRRIVEYRQSLVMGKKKTTRVLSHILGILDDVFLWTISPHRFIDPSFIDGAYEILGEIDQGRPRETGRPVGGTIVRVRPKKQLSSREVRSTTGGTGTGGTGEIPIGWIIFGLFMLVRACSSYSSSSSSERPLPIIFRSLVAY